MEEEVYRQILRIKALERWENEGGRVAEPEASNDRPFNDEEKRPRIETSERRAAGLTEQ